MWTKKLSLVSTRNQKPKNKSETKTHAFPSLGFIKITLIYYDTIHVHYADYVNGKISVCPVHPEIYLTNETRSIDENVS